jgi:glycosyltransferase involved in cell wall biosynthesis
MDLEGVSVVITNYNKGDLLLRAIESVVEQIDIIDEIIIVDDASTNSEDHVVLSYLNEHVVCSNVDVLINSNNMGVSLSKNRGVSKALNDIVVLLDGDDTLPMNALSFIKEGFASRDLDVLFGDYLHLNGDSEKIISCESISLNEMINPQALARNWLLLGTSPFRKSTCSEMFKFNANFNRTDDVDFHRQLILANKKIGYINKVIYNWNHFAGGNNDSIPLADILFSHAAGLKFYMSNLSGFDYFRFVIKFWIRFIILSIKR